MTDLIRIVSERTCFSAGVSGCNSNGELMFARLPDFLDHVVIGSAILPAKFPRETFPAIYLED